MERPTRMTFSEFLRHHNGFVARLFKDAIDRKQYRQARNLVLLVYIPSTLMSSYVWGLIKNWRDAVVVLALSPVVSLLVWTFFTSLLHTAARFFGGRARFINSLTVVGLTLIPQAVQLLFIPLTFIPVVGSYISLGLSILFTLWWIDLLYVGQSVVFGFDRRRASGSLMVAFIFLFVLTLISLGSGG